MFEKGDKATFFGDEVIVFEAERVQVLGDKKPVREVKIRYVDQAKGKGVQTVSGAHLVHVR